MKIQKFLSIIQQEADMESIIVVIVKTFLTIFFIEIFLVFYMGLWYNNRQILEIN